MSMLMPKIMPALEKQGKIPGGTWEKVTKKNKEPETTAAKEAPEKSIVAQEKQKQGHDSTKTGWSGLEEEAKVNHKKKTLLGQ